MREQSTNSITEGEVYSVHTETDVYVVGDIAVVVIRRGRGRPRKDKAPKEKTLVGISRKIREPLDFHLLDLKLHIEILNANVFVHVNGETLNARSSRGCIRNCKVTLNTE